MYNPEKDPVLNAAERRLYVVVDTAIEILAAAQPPGEIQSTEPVSKLPLGVVDINVYRDQRDEVAKSVQQEAIKRSRRDADAARLA